MMGWSTLISEAFCMRNICPNKSKYLYTSIRWDNLDDEPERIPNPDYKSGIHIPPKPKYCPMRRENGGYESPTWVCLEKDCKHLALSDADEREYR